ncbi:FecR family protein [Chitinophaga rhizophila]|uniref:FecR domain-containing protein n=1 Tax=Chitinophaga rhizophila TaxID=2866212 RepID=A0ABS7GKD4_9BACT|nr:FecR domain-containing protein [Chitinophaga rhizophila]MBW8688181.1 FecR domain-containing protein [Chitinophaga rhizophila]
MPVDPDYIEQLILEELTGHISPEDSITLKKLLEQDPAAQALWERMHAALTGADIQSVVEALPQELPSAHIITAARRRRRRTIIVNTTIGVAAMLLLALMMSKIMFPAFQPVSPEPIPSFALKSVVLQLPDGSYYQLGSGQQQFIENGISFREVAGRLSWSGGNDDARLATIRVPPGKEYTVQLPDGTTVQLNAASHLQFPLAFTSRREIHVSGEAYLQVAQHAQQPFRVQLPNSTIQVLGTAFNVNTYDSTAEQVLLETGAIRMQTKDGDIVLQPGQAVSYQPGRRPQIVDRDLMAVLSWKQGYYTFRSTPVAEVSKVLERNYRIRVVLDSEATSQRTYTSRLEKDEPLKTFLTRLKSIDNIDYRFETGDTVLHLLHRP